MSKTSRAQYFLWNGGTLPRSRRPPQESHGKFKLYVFMPFPWFVKVEPGLSLQFICLFF